MSKNKLQEIIQKSGVIIDSNTIQYNSKQKGDKFFSTVSFTYKDESYTIGGAPATSKKQAECNAAEVAIEHVYEEPKILEIDEKTQVIIDIENARIVEFFRNNVVNAKNPIQLFHSSNGSMKLISVKAKLEGYKTPTFETPCIKSTRPDAADVAIIMHCAQLPFTTNIERIVIISNDKIFSIVNDYFSSFGDKKLESVHLQNLSELWDIVHI